MSNSHNFDETFVCRPTFDRFDVSEMFICAEFIFIICPVKQMCSREWWYWFCLLAGKNQKNYAERRGSWQSGPSCSHHNLYPFFNKFECKMIDEQSRRRKRGGRKINNHSQFITIALILAFRLCSSAEYYICCTHFRTHSLSLKWMNCFFCVSEVLFCLFFFSLFVIQIFLNDLFFVSTNT